MDIIVGDDKRYFVEVNDWDTLSVKCEDRQFVVDNICCTKRYYIGLPDTGCGWEGIGCWIIEDTFIVS